MITSGDDIAPHVPLAGDLRITVPIPSAILVSEGREVSYPYRKVLYSGYEIAALNERERLRLEKGPYRIHADCRLEIFNQVEPSEIVSWLDGAHDRIDRLVTSTLAKLSLCVRDYFSGEFIVVDEYNGKSWRRRTNIMTTDRTHDGSYAHIPVGRLATWGALIGNWPADPDDALMLALGYFRESIMHRRSDRLASATVSAGIATEILFGDVNSELTHRISVRAAQLTAQGEDALRVQRAIKRLYGARSKVVHTGRGAEAKFVDIWHQLLMRAIPAAAAWGGSVSALQTNLDESTFVRSGDLARLQEEGEWWSFCDFTECLRLSPLA